LIAFEFTYMLPRMGHRAFANIRFLHVAPTEQRNYRAYIFYRQVAPTGQRAFVNVR